MQREVIKWLQSLELSDAVQNPKRDLATGHAAAEIVSRYSGTKYVNLQLLPNGASAATKRDIWLQVYNALQKLNCQSVTPQLIDAVLRREPNAALTVLECLYEHFTSHTLPMRGLDAVGTSRNAYVQPTNAASTAKLLAVANTGVSTSAKGEPSTLHDPLDAGNSPRDAAAAAHPNDTTTTNTAELAASEAAPPAEYAAHVLQQRLALIDNDELAGGANALGAVPRYARPTASTLVHTASGTRKDVVLDRAKYVADETQQRVQNARITQQHAVVRRLQEEAAATTPPPQQQQGDGVASSSWPMLNGTSGRANAVADDRLPLTTLYRGRFYREPETNTTKAASAAAGKKSRSGKKKANGKGESESESPFTANDDSEEPDGGGAHAADDALRPTSQGRKSRPGNPGNSRATTRLRVKVHSPALRTALALRSGSGQLRERAAAVSRELFAKHHYMLRPALSEILADVLGAHKQLEHLLDCSTDDGSGEVLENVLGHLLAHRQAFPLSCMKACWETLSQHVDGIVAALQNSPDEYSYLLESFSFAFTREAAQVPVLEPPASTTTITTVIDGCCDGGGRGDAESARENAALVSEEQEEDNGALDSAASSPHSSLVRNAATATCRTSEAAVGNPSTGGELPQRSAVCASSQQPLPIFVNARQQLNVASVFHLLSCVARQLDVPRASYVLRRYVLRAAKPFLLRHGTAAVREALARLVSATFVPTAPSPEETSTSNNGSSSRVTVTSAGAVDGEAGLVDFLTSELAVCMQVLPYVSQVFRPSSLSASQDTPGDNSETEATADKPPASSNSSSSSSSAARQRQRTYWHIFQSSIAEFPSSASHDEILRVPPPANGPLARCVHAAAVACLDIANAVDVRAVGVRLVVECCERWWGHAKDEAESSGLPRPTLRKLISHVLVSLDAEKDEAAAAMKAAWWNTQAAETWELRLMVLRLCTTLLRLSCRGADNGDSTEANTLADDIENVCRVADVAAAVCLATFAATASTATSRSAPLWQLQLALASVGAVVDPIRAPSLTAEWRQLLLTTEPSLTTSSILKSVVLPNEGVAVDLLLAPLQLFGGVRAFLPLKSQLRLSSVVAGAPSSQRTESLLSTSRPSKNGADSRGANGASRRGSTRTQRSTAQTVLGETAASFDSVADHSSVFQLVCGSVQPMYAVVPLYQTWSTHGVVDAMLSPPSSSRATTTPANEDECYTSRASPMQLQVTLAALASSPLHSRTEEGAYWSSVMCRYWPLIQATKPSNEALEAVGAHPPAFLQPQQIEDAPVEVMAILLVALFLRCADETTVASAVAAAEEDWRALYGSAMRWAEAVVDQGETI
ncbi:hypothetical protein ABB37_02507 [Leptomonas pyrrhocoris]|uniref:Calponin-homology (CH) domain-containing protein n=1 Tax=Leptomonas pyrrhocoris TaxID=157538 RepID=A0A0M9G5F5_LEPPY|nr:hypothetical protein ABB37_02507 [Leptomonas pyrrhocoris]XP_015661122.1 hypothetical protein ABB37_02507 [Leptomonas pyrrhocoris]KPA82682.1 hypothetical protein ABB37_02507 [Leptomonas pyrrhocoris]KPA82683.1 hypothetical protein ABB37_02507 [Leptomonas pyrrhocoris]|eukprot:XP_015661121.1 hypothetical protein ABB37_02507 [Leptomonas pyrrhocoris]